MRYFIDTANQKEIDKAISMGIKGITANPTLYKKEQICFDNFLAKNIEKGVFLSAEVMEDSLENMRTAVNKILDISKDLVIKLNYSSNTLILAKELNEKGIKTAITLIFDINQALLAIEAGVDYVFAFVARNEGIGIDGLGFVKDLVDIVKLNQYSTKIVAASIRNKYQLMEVAKAGVDYVAVPFKLISESFNHPLTISGSKKFEADWK